MLEQNHLAPIERLSESMANTAIYVAQVRENCALVTEYVKTTDDVDAAQQIYDGATRQAVINAAAGIQEASRHYTNLKYWAQRRITQLIERRRPGPNNSAVAAAELFPHQTLSDWRVIHETFSDDEEFQQILDSDERGISQNELRRRALEVLRHENAEEVRARNETSREELRANPVPLRGKYATIVLDPPWALERFEREHTEDRWDYPTMHIVEIADIPIREHLEDDAFVFLWTTQRFLFNAFETIEHWGLEPIFTMTWVKNGGMQVYNRPQFNSEFIVVGKQGNPTFLDLHNFSTAFLANRGAHSEKPEEFYQLLERVAPGPRLDMFARREHPGFVSWGNEVANGPTA